MASFAFTVWLSRQPLACPTWATDCKIGTSTGFIAANLGLVQGIVNTVYGLGLAIMSYTAYPLGQVALWPILTREPYTLRGVDNYLSATRGSIPSLPWAFFTAKSIRARTVVLCVATVTFLLQIDSLIIGFAYTTQEVLGIYQSNYTVGGGLGLDFSQSNPPVPWPEAVTSAFSLYTAWSKGLVSEPLPEYRHYIMQRDTLSHLGNISLQAVKAKPIINCTGRAINISDYDTVLFNVTTNWTQSPSVFLRIQPQLTLWVDHIIHPDTTRSVSTLVFAAINGSIEGGLVTEPTALMRNLSYTGISCVACSVDVTLVEEGLEIGNFTIDQGSQNNSIVSSLDDDFLGLGNTLGLSFNDVATWIGSAVTTYGIPIHGAQPMFSPNPAPNNTLPVSFTSSVVDTVNNWTLSTLQDFIHVGSGALSFAMVGPDLANWNYTNITLESGWPTPQLETRRSIILLAPAVLLLLLIALLALLDIWMHSFSNVPAVRLASTSELIASAQTSEIRTAALRSVVTEDEVELDSLKVWYGETADGRPALGVRESVNEFPRGFVD
ncbi:hypothetical protein MMC08_008579 [Hypocenomyce scalaris]|nr:hypothetical protein [Hypocenomyce scalaris]